MAEATSAAGREQELAAKLREQLSAANSDAARQVCSAALHFSMGYGMESYLCAMSVAVRLTVRLVPPLSSCDSRLEASGA